MEEYNDPELTKEQIELVAQLSESNLKAIDDALLSNISPQWRKVARVVGTTMLGIDNRVKDIPDVFYAQRVIGLVNKSIIESQGNLSTMHYCEVRRLL